VIESYVTPRLIRTAELIDDEDVVRAAVSRGGLALQYASRRLQEDPSIVRLACLSDGSALQFCPKGKTRDELTNDRPFMKDVVLAREGSGAIWKLIESSSPLREDQELLLLALKNGLLFSSVPVRLKDDIQFLEQVLKIKSQFYMEFSLALQAETALAHRAVISPDSTAQVHSMALTACPSLMLRRDIVLVLCLRGDVQRLPDLLGLPTSSLYTDDNEIMLAAVSRDPALVVLGSKRIRESPEYAAVLITPVNAYDKMKETSTEVMCSSPEIPTRAVEVCVTRKLPYLAALIPQEVWVGHRQLCLAWLRRGGGVLPTFASQLVVVPPYTHEHLELPLAVAQYSWREIVEVGDALLRDRAFILDALKLDGRILELVVDKWRDEPDVIVVGVANYNKHISRTPTDISPLLNILRQQIEIPQLTGYIEEQLTLHRTFVQCILAGIAIRPNRSPHPQCYLPMLHGGKETSVALTKLIAEYLGVPMGQQLSFLRDARAVLVNSSSPLSNVRRHVPDRNSMRLPDREKARSLALLRHVCVPAPPLGHPQRHARHMESIRLRMRNYSISDLRRVRSLLDRRRLSRNQDMEDIMRVLMPTVDAVDVPQTLRNLLDSRSNDEILGLPEIGHEA